MTVITLSVIIGGMTKPRKLYLEIVAGMLGYIPPGPGDPDWESNNYRSKVIDDMISGELANFKWSTSGTSHETPENAE